MGKPIRTRTIRNAASAALADMGTKVWHIHQPAFAALQKTLELMAETGQPIEAAVGKVVEASGPESRILVPSSEYSRRVQRVGAMAIIPIVGIIEPEKGVYSDWMGGTNCASLRSDLRIAAADKTITSIGLVIDSPGGQAFGLQETATLIAQINESKPITAYCRHLTASAAYFLACSAGTILATPSTAVGSVGTIIGHFSYAGMLEEIGIQYTQITHGENKGEGSMYMALDDKAKAGLQEFVDAYGKQFVAHVAVRRGVSTETVMQKFGQGRVYIASESLDRGMIDAIGMFEDAVAAGGGDGSIQQTAAATTPGSHHVTEPPKVKKLVAQMFALGMIESIEASAETVSAVMNAFCLARGVAVPKSEDGKLDEAKCIAIIVASQSQPAPNVAAAHKKEQGEAKVEMTAAQYKARRDEIAASAKQMNAGRFEPVITADQVATALDSPMSIEEIREQWAVKLEASTDGQAINVHTGSITAGAAGEEVFAANATNALMARMGHKVEASVAAKVPADMREMSLMDIACTCARFTGLRLHGGREDMAMQLLQQSPGRVRMSGSSFNRPGDFPNLLSNLANKVLDTAQMMAGAQFPLWTAKMMDLPNFQPRTVLGTASFDSLDLIEDDEEAKQLSMGDELKGWLQSRRYGNKVGLTPVMMANDDLDGFNQQLISLAQAHDLTLDDLCLGLLAGNVTMPDGTAMFASGHLNLVTSGGAPSAAQAEKNWLLHGAMKAYGSNTPMGSLPNLALVPLAHGNAAKQTYYDIARLNEVKVAATDATINVHRGSLERVVIEPKLDAYSAAKWYTFDTKIRTIVHAFMTGYGPSGKRETWFEPSRGTRYIQLEGSFAAGAVGFRGAVQNPGA